MQETLFANALQANTGFNQFSSPSPSPSPSASTLPSTSSSPLHHLQRLLQMHMPVNESSFFPTVPSPIFAETDAFEPIVMNNPSYVQLADKHATSITNSLPPSSVYYDSVSIENQQHVAQQAQASPQAAQMSSTSDLSKSTAFESLLVPPFMTTPNVASTASNSTQSHTLKKSEPRTASLKILKKSTTSRRSSKRDGRPSAGRRTSPNSKLRCDVCNQLYSRKDNLRAHQRVHNGEKPYKCNDCGASFRWLGALRTHQATHKPDSSSCDQNDLSSTQTSSLNCLSNASKSASASNIAANTDPPLDKECSGLGTSAQMQLVFEQCVTRSNVALSTKVPSLKDTGSVAVPIADAFINAPNETSVITATASSMTGTQNGGTQAMIDGNTNSSDNEIVGNNENTNNFGLDFCDVVNLPVNSCGNNLFPNASHASLYENNRLAQHSSYIAASPANDSAPDKNEELFQWDKPDDPFSFNDSFLSDSSVLSELVHDWMPVRAA